MPDLDPTLLKYASSCFQQGYTEPEIRRFLMQAGYDPASIDAAMNATRGASAPPTPPTPPSRGGAKQWGGAVTWGGAPPPSTAPPAFPPATSEPEAQTGDGGGSGFKEKAVKTVKKVARIVITLYILVMALLLVYENVARETELPNGSHCTSPNGCLSGHCVNGVCCETGHQCCGEPHHCGTGEAAPRACDFSKHYCVEKSSLVATPGPTQVPTPEATTSPTPAPTAEPTIVPTSIPTTEPASTPTFAPTPEPTSMPMPESEPAESVVMGLMLDALKIDMMMAKDNGGVTLGMITNTGVASVQINGIMTCLGESCTPTLSPKCAGYREENPTADLDQLLPSGAGIFVSNCFNNGDDYEPKTEGEEVTLGIAIDYTLVDTLEGRMTDTKHVAMEVTKASTPLDTTSAAEPTSAPTPAPTTKPTIAPTPSPTPTPVPTPIPTPIPVPDTISDLDLEDIEIAFIQAFDSGAVSLSQIKNKRKETIAITSVSTCTGMACTIGEAEGCQGVSGEDLFGTDIKYGDYIYLQNCYNNGEEIVSVFAGQEVSMKLRLSYKVSGSDTELSTTTAEFTISVQKAQTPLVTPVPPPESYIMDLPFERFNAHFVQAEDTGGISIVSLNNTGTENVSIKGILTCLGEPCEPKISPECIGYSPVTESQVLSQTLSAGTGLFVLNCYNDGENYVPKTEGEEITFGVAIRYTIGDGLEELTTETKRVTVKVSKATRQLKTNPLDLPKPHEYLVSSFEPTTGLFDIDTAPNWEYKKTDFKVTDDWGMDNVTYTYMNPIYPATYQYWMENDLMTVKMLIEPKVKMVWFGEVTYYEMNNIEAAVRIQGLMDDWKRKTIPDTNKPVWVNFSISLDTNKLFSFEKQIKDIEFELKYDSPSYGDGKVWHETAKVDIASKNDFALVAIEHRENAQDHPLQLIHYNGLLPIYVTSRDPEIEKIITAAKEHLPGRTFEGYLPGSTPVMEQVAAIYRTIHDMGISYVNSPISFSGEENETFVQNIRLPADSIASTNANCVDGTLLFASALERAAINPLIVLVPGHAYLGIQLEKDMNAYVFLETTMVGNEKFSVAIKAQSNFERTCSFPTCPVWYIDVTEARKAGVNPLTTA